MSNKVTEHEHEAVIGDEHSIAHAKQHMRTYAIVGLALMVGTLLTVWAAFIDFGSHEWNIVVALVIACTKGALVGGFFMHLISEKKMVYTILAFTVFFVIGLFWLTLYAMRDFPTGTTMH